MQFRDRIKELRRVPAGQLIPHPQNPRIHPPEQRAALEGILKEIGYAGALLAREDEQGLHIIDGHLRADTSPDQNVPVLVLDVTAEEADKILLTHDPLAAMAKTDVALLDALSRSVRFDDPNVTAMLEALAKAAKLAAPVVTTIEDEIPELETDPKKIITRPGDLYLLGPHRFVCGDATNADDVAHALGGHKPKLMVTDPPYGVDYDPNWRLRAGVNKPWQKLAEGTVTNDSFADWRQAYALFPGAVAYIWHASLQTDVFVASVKACEFEVRAIIVWKKNLPIFGRGHYHWQHEPCLYCVRKGKAGDWTGDRKQSTVWDIPAMHVNSGNQDDGKNEHSTQKPIECMARPMRNHGKAGEAVYDPFLGSGSTIIAGEQLGRPVYGLEVLPEYCDLIIRRWEAFTGKKAKRIPGPEPKPKPRPRSARKKKVPAK